MKLKKKLFVRFFFDKENEKGSFSENVIFLDLKKVFPNPGIAQRMNILLNSPMLSADTMLSVRRLDIRGITRRSLSMRMR